nr:uncharacterized protein LOC124806781 [Hydra vulgaris]
MQIYKNASLACISSSCLELILESFWKALFQKKTSSDDNIEFKNFQKKWLHSKQIPLKLSNRSLDLENSFLKQKANETCNFLEKVLQSKHHPRDNYKEAAELAIFLLGGEEPKKWKTCSAHHHARWMAHLLYAPKMLIFKKDLTESDFKNLKIFLTFSSAIYIKAWLEAPKACDAPINNIKLFNDLEALKGIPNFGVPAEKAQYVLSRHSWYLTEQVSVLSLFSNKLSLNVKDKIVKKMLECGKPLGIIAINQLFH